MNIIATPKGGTHVAGFERALTRSFASALQNTRLLKAGEEVVKDDVLEGLTAVVTVRLAEPQFEGQTKEVLGTPAVARLVTKAVERELTAFLTSTKGATKSQARAVLEKVVGASRARVAARQHREAQRRKNALESSSLPPKLVDCRSTDVDRTELFIVEGDSALGTAKLARNSEFQALLPIRGKILNVQKASIGDMLKNAECASIIQVVGAGSGRGFDLDAARYGKIIFMADADSDGAHIRCLLATLFFRYMRPLVDAGRVFTAVPPLHRFELTNAAQGPGEVHLHLLRRGVPAQGRRADQAGPELQGAAALQGAGRDGRRPAGRDDDEPAAPDAAPDDGRRRADRRDHVRDADGQRRRPAQGPSSSTARTRWTPPPSTPDARAVSSGPPRGGRR